MTTLSGKGIPDQLVYFVTEEVYVPAGANCSNISRPSELYGEGCPQSKFCPSNTLKKINYIFLFSGNYH